MPESIEERRAKFVYEGARVESAMADRPIKPEPWEERDAAFRENMVMAVSRQCGEGKMTSPEEIHECWVRSYKEMGWIYGEERDTTKKTHPDMVPFNELGKKEQEKDWVFFMLCEIAEKMY